jgi:uncharacterized Tic20 family protein
LESAVLTAIRRYPGDRFRSAAEFAAVLGTGAAPASRAIVRPEASAHLVGLGSRFPLAGREIVIGRGPSSDVATGDGLVSPRHARIERRGDGYAVLDLSSDNGTYVNGRRVRGSATLRNGDRLRVGRTEFVFAAPVHQGTRAYARRSPADEDLWVALCHASAVFALASVVVPLVPILAPLAVWAVAGRGSSAIGFHARQAFMFQAAVAVAMIAAGSAYEAYIWLLSTAFAWYGALRLSQGRDFRYPVLGRLASHWG